MSEIIVLGPSPKLEIYKDVKHEWRWSIRIGSETIAASTEGYKNKEDCLENIRNVERRIKYFRERGDIA